MQFVVIVCNVRVEFTCFKKNTSPMQLENLYRARLGVEHECNWTFWASNVAVYMHNQRSINVGYLQC